MRSTPDLNAVRITDENAPNGEALQLDYGLSVDRADLGVRVIFKDHLSALDEFLAEADCVVGVVAWLTNQRVLKGLAGLPHGVSIVVNKEDWLRPDGQRAGWQRDLRRAYDALRSPDHYAVADNVCYCGDPFGRGAIRCAGFYNRDKNPACPRVHHKFLVACRAERHTHRDSDGYTAAYDSLTPYAAWTGSLNLTFNATKSLENVVVIRSEQVASAYFKEWRQTLLLSEPLDWSVDWSAPDLRIGS